MDKELRQTLITDLGINHLPEDAQNQIIARLGELALRSMTVAIFEQLSSEQRAEFETVSATNDPEKIQTFLAEYIPNIAELMHDELQKTITRFKQQDATPQA